MITDDTIGMQSTVEAAPQDRVEEAKGSIKSGREDYSYLYGLTQTQYGQRALQKRANEIKGLSGIVTLLASVAGNIIASVTNTFNLGSSTVYWKNGYINNLFSNGSQVTSFKEIAAPAGGNIVADSLTDTLNLTSSDNSVTITNDPATDTIDFTADQFWTRTGTTIEPATAGDNIETTGTISGNTIEAVLDLRGRNLISDGDSGSGLANTTQFTNAVDTPTTNPGWTTSDTVAMNAPDGYIKAYYGTQAIVIPYWNT